MRGQAMSMWIVSPDRSTSRVLAHRLGKPDRPYCPITSSSRWD